MLVTQVPDRLRAARGRLAPRRTLIFCATNLTAPAADPRSRRTWAARRRRARRSRLGAVPPRPRRLGAARATLPGDAARRRAWRPFRRRRCAGRRTARPRTRAAARAGTGRRASDSARCPAPEAWDFVREAATAARASPTGTAGNKPLKVCLF